MAHYSKKSKEESLEDINEFKEVELHPTKKGKNADKLHNTDKGSKLSKEKNEDFKKQPNKKLTK